MEGERVDETYTLINRNGAREQVPFFMRQTGGLEVPYVSMHITKREVDDAWTGRIIILDPLIALFERAREVLGRPITINSGYRTPEYQKHLKNLGLRVAEDSPHCHGAALDLAIPKGQMAMDLADALKKAAQDLGLPAPRLGIRLYDFTFVHVDLVFLLFEPYARGRENPHPTAWRPGVEW